MRRHSHKTRFYTVCSVPSSIQPFDGLTPRYLELFTDPPVGFLDISLANLQDLEDDIWPTQRADCYYFDADPPPSACDECDIPAYRAPGPLRIGAGAGGCPSVTVGVYIRELGAWLESETVARDRTRVPRGAGRSVGFGLSGNSNPATAAPEGGGYQRWCVC